MQRKRKGFLKFKYVRIGIGTRKRQKRTEPNPGGVFE
jgi:hypothetical protein